MKSLRQSKISRWARLEGGCFALLAFSLTLAPAHADERPLTDADVERYLPRLRAEASAMEITVRQGLEEIAAFQAAIAEHETLMADMQSGKTDILAWLSAHTDHTLVPAGAVYSPECSRAVTGATRAPTAVFTFWKESPYRSLLRKAAAGDTAALGEYQRQRGEGEMRSPSAAAEAIRDLVAETVSFYLDRGFVEPPGIDWTAVSTFLVPPDECVLVTVWDVNRYAGVIQDCMYPECSALPTGPLIEISFRGGPQEQATSAPAVEEEVDFEYERVKMALYLARVDAANPSALEVEIPPDAPPAVKAELRALAAEFAVRKANMAVYRRHEAALAPILKTLALEGTADQ